MHFFNNDVEAGDIIDMLNVQFKLSHFWTSAFVRPQKMSGARYPDPVWAPLMDFVAN